MRLGEVVQLVLAGVHAARRRFVQQRLPQMCSGTFYQRDARSPAPAEAVAKPGDEFEPRRAAADHNDSMQAFALNRLVREGCHLIGTRICDPDVILDLAVSHLRHRGYSG